MVHLGHPCAQGGEVLHGLAAVIIVQVALEGVLHGRQVHVRHRCSISLLQRTADLLHKVPNLRVQQQLTLDLFRLLRLVHMVLTNTDILAGAA